MLERQLGKGEGKGVEEEEGEGKGNKTQTGFTSKKCSLGKEGGEGFPACALSPSVSCVFL